MHIGILLFITKINFLSIFIIWKFYWMHLKMRITFPFCFKNTEKCVSYNHWNITFKMLPSYVSKQKNRKSSFLITGCTSKLWSFFFQDVHIVITDFVTQPCVFWNPKVLWQFSDIAKEIGNEKFEKNNKIQFQKGSFPLCCGDFSPKQKNFELWPIYEEEKKSNSIKSNCTFHSLYVGTASEIWTCHTVFL